MAKLSSVLKNVPIDMMWKLRKYHTPNAHQEIRWRARQPVKGKKVDWCGNLKFEDAKSADLYAYERNNKYHKLWREAVKSFNDLQVGYKLLQTQHEEELNRPPKTTPESLALEHALSLYRGLYNRVYSNHVTNRWSRILQKVIDYLFILKARANDAN